MQANRLIEAAAAFEIALRGSGKTRADAAYGQSLAYLRVGLSDMAAVAASNAPLDSDRGVQLKTALLEPINLAAELRALRGPEIADIFVRAPLPAWITIPREQIYSE